MGKLFENVGDNQFKLSSEVKDHWGWEGGQPAPIRLDHHHSAYWYTVKDFEKAKKLKEDLLTYIDHGEATKARRILEELFSCIKSALN